MTYSAAGGAIVCGLSGYGAKKSGEMTYRGLKQIVSCFQKNNHTTSERLYDAGAGIAKSAVGVPVTAFCSVICAGSFFWTFLASGEVVAGISGIEDLSPPFF